MANLAQLLIQIMDPKTDNWQALRSTRRTLIYANPVQSVSQSVQLGCSILLRLCCFACVASHVLSRRFGIGVVLVVVVVVVIIAFTLMPFAMFETSDRYLTQKLIMSSKKAVHSDRNFELCKRQWSELNNQAELFASWKLRSL